MAARQRPVLLEHERETVDVPGGGTSFTLREPYGVVGRLIPFNHPIQFAAAGVNAHVDLDLAVAVAATCVKMRSEPTSGKKHRDYMEINKIFAEQIQALRESYEHGPLARLLDRIAAPFLDLVSDAAVVEARAVAWKRAVELWALRERPVEDSAFVERLDEEAQVAGLLLLEPVL